MIETRVTIVNKLGLHARAAAKFVACASAFSSDIRTGIDGKLAAGKGTVLDLQIQGRDEHEALAALQQLIDNRFGEPE